jgi:hypothetical protein
VILLELSYRFTGRGDEYPVKRLISWSIPGRCGARVQLVRVLKMSVYRCRIYLGTLARLVFSGSLILRHMYHLSNKRKKNVLHSHVFPCSSAPDIYPPLDSTNAQPGQCPDTHVSGLFPCLALPAGGAGVGAQSQSGYSPRCQRQRASWSWSCWAGHHITSLAARARHHAGFSTDFRGLGAGGEGWGSSSIVVA